MGLKLTGMFKECKDYAIGIMKNACIRKTAVAHLKIKGESLYIKISLPSTVILVGKRHWLLVIGCSTNHA